MKLVSNKLVIILFIAISCLSCKRNIEPRKAPISQINTFPETNEKSTENDQISKIRYEFNHTTIITWNIRHLGKTKSDQEINQIAQLLRNFDIVALQEVVAKDPGGAQAVAKIADELNRMGTKWDYRISDPTNSPSANISERYAFLWKTAKVDIKGRAFLDSDMEEEYLREPYIAKFQTKKGTDPFFVINYHSRKFNDRPEEEIIHFKDYPNRLKTNRIFMVGDFNLNEKHPVWDSLFRIGYKPALINQKTTLKVKCKNGNYLNHAIDNIYYPTQFFELINSGTVDFVGGCNNLDKARAISDHLPAYIEFSNN